MCTKDVLELVDPLKLMRDVPGSPEAVLASQAAFEEGGTGTDPLGEQASTADIAGFGSAIAEDESSRKVARAAAALAAVYFGGAAAMNAAGGAGAATAEGIAATEAAGAIGGAATTAEGAAAGAGVTTGAAAGTTAAGTVAGGFTTQQALQLASLAPLLMGSAPSGQASPDVEAPTAPPASETGLTPTAAQLKARKKVGDPTALTGPGGIPFGDLTLGRATILGG